MTMKLFASFLLALFCTACHALPFANGSPQRQPNVIVIFTDDQGFGDLSCYGHPTIRTPHVDALAAGGAKFTQFYVASPVCSPSRAALLTGCYPKRVGMHKHVIFPAYDYGLHPDEVTIADLLGQEGYATGCFGSGTWGTDQDSCPQIRASTRFLVFPIRTTCPRCTGLPTTATGFAFLSCGTTR